MNTFEENTVSVSWHAIKIVLIGLHYVFVSWTESYGSFAIISQNTFFGLRLATEVDPFVKALKSLNVILI